MDGVAARRPIFDAAGRIVGIILALLLIGVPVVLLLMAYGVLPDEQVRSATGYRAAMSGLEEIAASGPTGDRIWFGVVAAVVAVIALALLLLMVFVRPRSRSTVVQDHPGAETVMRSRAVRHLAEGAARSGGAVEPDVDLRSRGGTYDLSSRFGIRDFERVPARVEEIRGRIRSELAEAGVRTRRVEATLQELGASRAERERVS